MTDQTAILIVIALIAIVAVLFIFSARQKRRFEAEQIERKRKLEQIKRDAKAREAAANPSKD